MYFCVWPSMMVCGGNLWMSEMIQHCSMDSESLEWSLTGRFLQGHACKIKSLFCIINVVFIFQNMLDCNINDAQKKKERCLLMFGTNLHYEYIVPGKITTV